MSLLCRRRYKVSSIVPPVVLLHGNSDFTDSGSAGITWSDQSGASRIAIDTTTKKFGAGAIGRSVQESTRGLTPSSLSFLDYNNDLTIEFWFYRVAQGGTRAIFSSKSALNTNVNRGFTCNLNTSSTTLAINFVDSANTNTALYSVSLTESRFYHVALECQNKVARCYIDGVVQPTEATFTSTVPTVGAFELLGDCGTVNFAAGTSIDEFAVFNYAKYKDVDFTPNTSEY